MSGNKEDSVEYCELDTPEGRSWNEHCSPEIYDEGYIKLGKTRGVFARSYLTFYDRIKNFQIKDDDVWVVSFPKTGTTWTQEMIWCMMNNLDFKAAEEDLGKRFPYFEVRANWSPRLASLIHRKVILGIEDEDDKTNANESEATATDLNFFMNSFDLTEKLGSPRFVKSHLHFSLLPQQLIERSTKAKMIYVARNPKDTCVSFYHHSCLLDGYNGTLEQFVEQFITDNVFCSPFWTHLKEFWEHRNRGDILFIKYEDMKKDLPSVIHRVADFLGKSMSQEEIERLADHLSFEKMKNNPSVNQEYVVENLRKIHGRTHNSSFMRKGQVGTWKDELSPEMIARLDNWIQENHIEGLY